MTTPDHLAALRESRLRAALADAESGQIIRDAARAGLPATAIAEASGYSLSSTRAVARAVKGKAPVALHRLISPPMDTSTGDWAELPIPEGFQARLDAALDAAGVDGAGPGWRALLMIDLGPGGGAELHAAFSPDQGTDPAPSDEWEMSDWIERDDDDGEIVAVHLTEPVESDADGVPLPESIRTAAIRLLARYRADAYAED